MRRESSAERHSRKRGAGRLGASDALANLLKIVSIKLNQIAECLRVARISRNRWLAAIDASLDLERPLLGALAAKERLIDILSLPAHLGSP